LSIIFFHHLKWHHLDSQAALMQKLWFFIDSAVNFHSLQQNAVLQID